MTNDRLLKAAQKERRRIVLAFTLVLLAAIGVLGTGWATAWNGRQAWHEQSISWQDRYVELYEEYTQSTGQEPAAPAPDDVAKDTSDIVEGTAGVQGPPGPVGPAGPAGANGRNATDGQIASAVSAFCLPIICVGKAGEDGERGPIGPTGRDGAPGADSTVPGPQGATGPPGRDGAPGMQGTTGRGIETLTCDDTGEWQVTYTDGITVSAGTCRIDPITPTTPGETP